VPVAWPQHPAAGHQQRPWRPHARRRQHQCSCDGAGGSGSWQQLRCHKSRGGASCWALATTTRRGSSSMQRRWPYHLSWCSRQRHGVAALGDACASWLHPPLTVPMADHRVAAAAAESAAAAASAAAGAAEAQRERRATLAPFCVHTLSWRGRRWQPRRRCCRSLWQRRSS
jgi:hypothetical protein